MVNIPDSPVLEMNMDTPVRTSAISYDGADILDTVIREGWEYGYAAC